MKLLTKLLAIILFFMLPLQGVTDSNATENNATENNVTVDSDEEDIKEAKRKEKLCKPFWKCIEFEYELDAYYSNISWTFPLTHKPIANARDKSEWDIYTDLLLKAIPPRFIILELSLNPLPVTGVYLKDKERQFYDDSVIFNDLNLVEAITAGFEEPYAVSLFIGNTVKFTRPGTRKAGSNRAYAGLLISWTDKHIKQNDLIDDQSYEIEWKILGSRDLNDYKLKWSYRIGAKLHEHPEITDSVYIGFRRSRLDFESAAFSWINNSAFEVTSIFSKETYNPIGHEIYFEKKFPTTIGGKKVGINFGLGYIYQGANKYTGTLKQQGVNTDQIIIRPNIQF